MVYFSIAILQVHVTNQQSLKDWLVGLRLQGGHQVEHMWR